MDGYIIILFTLPSTALLVRRDRIEGIDVIYFIPRLKRLVLQYIRFCFCIKVLFVSYLVWFLPVFLSCLYLVYT